MSPINGHLRQVARFAVVEQAGESKALTIAQLNTRAGSPGAQGGNHKALEPDTVCEVDRRNFRFELEPDVIFVDDGWFKVQTDAVFLKHDGDCALPPPPPL